MVLNSEDDGSRTVIAGLNQGEGTPMKSFLDPGIELNNTDVSAGFASTSRYGNGGEHQSMKDSGYGPSGQSFATTDANTDKEGARVHPLVRAGSLPLQRHSNLFHFIKPLDEATKNRFNDVIPVIEELLQPVISSLPKPCLVAIRRMFLGTDEADIAAYIVIFCKQNHRKKIENSVRTSLVRDLCESPGLPLLKILVTDPAPRPRLAQSSIEVCRNRVTTLCGTPILLVNKSEEAGCDDTRKATVGGIIKITTADGKSELYGMTAGHVLDNWQNAATDMDGNDSTWTYEDFSTQELAESNDAPPSPIELESQHLLSEAWDFVECDAFAEGVDSRNLARLANRDVQPSHDWTLFKTKLSKPNELCALKSLGHLERRELKEAARPTFHDELSDPVIMMGGSHGPKRGELSSLMARILIGSSDTFVDAYILTLNEQGAICDGDSGSWVVHNASPLVFGHVVATDAFEDVYVIPLLDTFDDIKRCLGAVSVELPTDEDFKELKTVEPSIIEKPETEISTIKGLKVTAPVTHSRKVPQPRNEFLIVEGSEGVAPVERLSTLPRPGKHDHNCAGRRSRGEGTSQSTATPDKLATGVPRASESRGDIQLDDRQQYTIPAAEENFNKFDRRLNETLLGNKRASPFLNLTHGEWNPVFATRRPRIDYSIENKPYIETRGVDKSVVRTFMQGSDESDVCLPQADKVEDYCFGANLESLETGVGEASKRPVALLDDRSYTKRGGRSRPYRGPLTARDLYMELKKPRFHCGVSSNLTGNNTNFRREGSAGNASEIKKYEEEEELDADRRLIFITNLDRWTMYALMGTASDWQALGLRDALYKHLAFETSIGVTFPPKGLALFQLEFHLPYYVLRKSEKASEDHRRDANGRPLRQTRDVSFLDWTSSMPSGFLYEAQITCLITGSDESRWVAYGFVDNYFDPAEEGKETVLSYHEDSLDEDGEGMRPDPLTFGTLSADNPIWDPRDYFLEVFRVRLHQVMCEWQQVVVKVRQSIREYTHDFSLSLSGERFLSKEAVGHDDKVRKSRNWVVQVRMLSKQLSMDLSKTVNACERFCLRYSIYFQSPSEPANSHRSLAAIQMLFDELESQKGTLESLAERCDDFARDLEHQLIVENLEVGVRQHKLSKGNEGLLVILLLYISPIALTAGIFSMNDEVIPFIPTSFGSFVGLLFTFALLGIVIHVVQRGEIWRVATALVGQIRWDRKIRGSLGQSMSNPQGDLEKGDFRY